jgi:hypothetical protein
VLLVVSWLEKRSNLIWLMVTPLKFLSMTEVFFIASFNRFTVRTRSIVDLFVWRSALSHLEAWQHGCLSLSRYSCSVAVYCTSVPKGVRDCIS